MTEDEAVQILVKRMRLHEGDHEEGHFYTISPWGLARALVDLGLLKLENRKDA